MKFKTDLNIYLLFMKQIFIIIFLAVSQLCTANPVDLSKAYQEALQFIKNRNQSDSMLKSRTRINPQLELAYTHDGEIGNVFYVFNQSQDQGFVIVSADDRSTPILGYADKGSFDISNLPDGLKDLLTSYEKQISYAVKNNIGKSRAPQDWTDIEPLIQTQWDQHEPYNNLCPIDPADGQRSAVGCTAVALAQVLNYHQWPQVGYGSVSYECNGEQLSADLSQIHFDWEMMKPEYFESDDAQAVSSLMYYCALSVKSQFSSYSTSGWLNSSEMHRLFGYKNAMWQSLANTSLDDFESIIYQDLQEQRPVLFSSKDPEKGGHMMVIDGYKNSDFFHINFGWGGDNDGFFKLSVIDADWYSFTTDQSIIYNIIPDHNAPLQSNVYSKENYQLSDDGTILIKWLGDETNIDIGSEAALWNVESIADYAFENCTALGLIHIPDWITNVGTGVFVGCTGLRQIIVGDSHDKYSVKDGMLMSNSDTKVVASTAKANIVIPATVTEIDAEAFSNSIGLRQIAVQNSTPPYLSSTAFNGVDCSRISLYVPKESISSYKSASGWNQFTNIIATEKPGHKKMIVYTTDGGKTEISLSQNPQFKNTGSALELSTLGRNMTFSLDKLLKVTFEEKIFAAGDVNGDDKVELSDLIAIINHIGGKKFPGFIEEAADINRDGTINIADVVTIVNKYFGNSSSHARATEIKQIESDSQKDHAMYVFRNDGRMNAFLMNQVDSLTYSCIGADGVDYGFPVAQLVWTKDSLYRIPVASIDSIGYQTPDPIFKKDIFFIDESNVSTVANVDFNTMAITFNAGTVNLPADGQIIYSDLEEGLFPMGFSGRVTSVTTRNGQPVYICQSAGPEEVFDRLLMVGRIESDGTHYNSARRRLSKEKHAEPEYSINTTLFDFLTLDGKGTLILDYDLDINAFNSEPATFYLKMKHDFSVDIKLKVEEKDMQGAIDSPYVPDEKVKELWSFPIELLSVGPIHLDLNVGSYFSYGGAFSMELSGLKYKYTNIREFSWSSDRPLYIEHRNIFDEGKWADLYDEVKLKTELSGKVSFGLCAELALVLWKQNWMSLGLEFKIGPELKGSVSLDTDLLKTGSVESAVYKEFSENVKFTMGLKLGADLKARLKKDEWTILSASTTIFPLTATLFPKLSKPAMPKIMKIGKNDFYTETNYGWATVSPMSVKTTATNITLFPGPYGLAIYDKDGKELFNHFTEDFESWHWIENSCFSTPVGKYASKTITVYPQYKFLGFIPIKGEPAEIVVPEPLSLSKSSVEISEGNYAQVKINGGWGYLKMDFGDEGIASVTHITESDDYQYLRVFGKKTGKTKVTVTDVRSGDVKSFDVVVKPGEIVLSDYTIKLKVGEEKSISVSPIAAYTLESSNSDIAVAMADYSFSNINIRPFSSFKVIAKQAGTATITVTDSNHGYTTKLIVEVEEKEPEVDYKEGICSNPSPEDGATIDGTGVSLSCNSKYGLDYEVRLSDKSDMSNIVKRKRISNSVYAVDFYDLKPNTKYYWRVLCYDTAEFNFVNCSPIWSFTTGSE